MTRPGLQEIGLDTLVHEVAASGQNEAYERSALCVCVLGAFLRDDGESGFVGGLRAVVKVQRARAAARVKVEGTEREGTDP
jgi:hypothetical protein